MKGIYGNENRNRCFLTVPESDPDSISWPQISGEKPRSDRRLRIRSLETLLFKILRDLLVPKSVVG
jgi:hypothetical protein